jgi:hypothetical protein
MALGAGMMTGGVGRGFQAAAVASAADDKRKAGVSRHTAAARRTIQTASTGAENFPDCLRKFPVLPQEFPALLSREFGTKPPKSLG